MQNEVHVGKLINNFAKKLNRAIGKGVMEYGVTNVQSRIIGFVNYNSNKRDIFQKDIEEELEIRRSSVTSVLQLMEKNGYIERISVSEDARLKKIILTEKGKEINQKVWSVILKIEASLREELTNEEIEIFAKLMNKLDKKISD